MSSPFGWVPRVTVLATVVGLPLNATPQTTVHLAPDLTKSTVTVSRVPNGEATHLLEALIPTDDKHHMNRIEVYTPGGVTDKISLGLHCSSSSSGNVDEDGHISTSGDSSCRELHKNINEVWLGLRDAAQPDAAYLITARCTEAWRWDHCEVPPAGTYYNVVLQQEKHGNFKIYIGVEPKLGGKVKVSTWDVLYLDHVVPKTSAP
jgi:hypothetical protein